MLSPYWKLICESLTRRYRLRIFVSTLKEGNRPWPVDWSNLDVVLQRTLTFSRKWRHPAGFTEPIVVHIPLDTVTQLRRFRAEVVLSSEMGFRTLLACVYRSFFRKSRLLVIAEVAESTERGRGHLRSTVRRVIRDRPDGFLVPGRSGARFISSLGVPDSKIFQIGYTSDVQTFSAIPLTRSDATAHRLLYVGQLIERKGLMPFVKALARWASLHPGRILEFVLVGDGPCRTKLENARIPSNLRTIFRGNMAFSSLAAVYAECGLFVFPTLADTWGVVVNEAMAAGLPVIGSLSSQAVQELVSPGHNGWSFQPDRPEDMFLAIDSALNMMLEDLNNMRQSARNRALQYTPETVAAKISHAVDRVLAKHR